MRKLHNKSRFGCKECKARRIKCDETRPACAKCAQTSRQCSFLAERPILPSPPKSVASSTGQGEAPRTFGPLPNVPRQIATSSVAPPSGLASDLNSGLLQFKLFYHFEHDVAEAMSSHHPNMAALMKGFIMEGLESPYLMDQILAYGAAHKSVVDVENRQFYQIEATKLQTRALTTYNNARPVLSETTCHPMFIFSSLLGHHILLDVSNESKETLGATLDGLTRSVSIHKGISAMAQASWPMFTETLQDHYLESCLRDQLPQNCVPHDDVFLSLAARIRATDLNPQAIQVLIEAVDVLQDIFNNHDPARVWVAMQDWLVRVPEDYMECLNQRRPEALVILAYYAVLLHRGNFYWFIGDLGQRLLHLIVAHLGPFWVDWLEWPVEQIEGKGSRDGSQSMGGSST